MTTTEPRPAFRKKGFIAAAVLIGIILLAAIIVLITTFTRGDETPASEPTNAAAPAPTPTSDAADESVCGLDGFEAENTLSQAPDAAWELVGTAAAPTDPAVGPGEVDADGFRTCFAHTAEGALFAAVNFIATGTDATIGPRLIELVAPGPGRDVLQNTPSSGAGGSALRAQVAGFIIADYTADVTTVDLALNYSTGDLVSFPLKLIWAEGDWKMQMTAEGELPLSPSPITNLGGYTPWSGA